MTSNTYEEMESSTMMIISIAGILEVLMFNNSSINIAFFGFILGFFIRRSFQ